MICYKDRTYCRLGLLCKKSGECSRVITQEVIEDAVKVGLPICEFDLRYGFPDCYVPFFEPDNLPKMMENKDENKG